MPSTPSYHIGFISTRFAGTDGVSLETAKWAQLLEEMGHTCYYFSGLSDRPSNRSYTVDEAFYLHPEVLEQHGRFFGRTVRSPEDSAWINQQRAFFKLHLLQFIDQFQINFLIPQNIFAIPLQLPLALALTEIIAETGMPTIAHHHDFAWERKRFLVSSVNDILDTVFPPKLPSIQHVVINTHAQQQLAWRKGLTSTLIPNVMPFEQPPTGIDEYNSDLREALGISPDELFVLQPTRVVQRKGIEQAMELIQRLGRKARLVISHASGDEGDAYQERLESYARLLGVSCIFGSDRFDEHRRIREDGSKVYSLWDAYPHADLVTYPSLIEGFGNALLEAIYFKKLVVVNNYPIYATDIKPTGVQMIEFDEFITAVTVEEVARLLDSPEEVQQMVGHNYRLGLQYFSMRLLKDKLSRLLADASPKPLSS